MGRKTSDGTSSRPEGRRRRDRAWGRVSNPRNERPGAWHRAPAEVYGYELDPIAPAPSLTRKWKADRIGARRVGVQI